MSSPKAIQMYSDVLLTVHFSIFILVINQLDAQHFCFTISLFRSLCMFRAHVLIIRSSKLHYTASGIITSTGVFIKSSRYCRQVSIKCEFYQQILEKSSNTMFHENLSSGSRVVLCELIDGQM